MIEVKINGLFLTQSQASGVILKELDGDRTLPIIIGEYEAQSIALGLENITPPRPITHDLVLNLLETLEAQIERIIISDLRNNTYYAIIQLRRRSELLEIDARPSDCIALAVAHARPIFVAARLFEQVEDMSEIFEQLNQAGSTDKPEEEGD